MIWSTAAIHRDAVILSSRPVRMSITTGSFS